MRQRANASNIYWGFVLLAFGGLFLLRNLDIIDFQFAMRTYWPLILIVVGLSIIIKSLSKKQQQSNENS